MLKNPRFSIITVVYNGVGTIEQTINSVFNQTYDNVEYIVIDGASNDGTQEIVEKYRDRIAYYASEPDNGIYDAMNKGIINATGDIVAFLNSDDWYEDDALLRVKRHFEESEIDMLLGSVNVVRNERKLAVISPDMDKMLWTIPCCHQGVFAKRELFLKFGMYHLKYKICADYDWILRIYNSGAKIKCVQDMLANFRDDGYGSTNAYHRNKEFVYIAMTNAREKGLTSLVERIKKEYEKPLSDSEGDYRYELVLKNDVDFFKEWFECDTAYYIWGTGHYGRMCFKLLEILKIKVLAFVDNNRFLTQTNGCMVIGAEQIGGVGKICVSTLAYEKEVLTQLEQMGIPRERILCFSDVRVGAINYAKQQYPQGEVLEFDMW